ncbi:hypothetical protein ACLOJK_041950 [Asimina triloba]
MERGVAAMCGGAWEEAAGWAGSIVAVELWPWPDLWASPDCWQAWFGLLAIGSRCLRWFGDEALLPGVVGSRRSSSFSVLWKKRVCSLGGPLILMALNGRQLAFARAAVAMWASDPYCDLGVMDGFGQRDGGRLLLDADRWQGQAMGGSWSWAMDAGSSVGCCWTMPDVTTEASEEGRRLFVGGGGRWMGKDDDRAPYWCSVLRRSTVHGVPADVDFVF